MISVRYHRGLELPEHGLWLDPEEGRPFAFVSHAHADHIARHAEYIASAGTARFMQARVIAVVEHPADDDDHPVPSAQPALDL